MDIHATKDILVSWIQSCNREQQIDRLEISIPEILNTLFERSERKEEIEWVKTSLINKMAEQRKIIKRLFFNSIPDKN
jgi:hypothetical protein